MALPTPSDIQSSSPCFFCSMNAHYNRIEELNICMCPLNTYEGVYMHIRVYIINEHIYAYMECIYRMCVYPYGDMFG